MTHNAAKIKTIWFDLGNVVLFFDFLPAFKKVSRFTSMNVKEIQAYFRHRPELADDLDEGRVSSKRLYHKLCLDLRIKGLSYSRFKTIWNNIFTPNHSVVTLIPRLKRNGYRLILISNTNRLHFDHLRSRYKVLRFFDSYVLSYRLGAQKPKRKIYRHALSVSRANQDEIFYTDDRAELIKAAETNHGVYAHTFRGINRLKNALKALRVNYA